VPPAPSLHLSRTLYKSHLFMQNEPNFPDDPMNVTKVLTKDYVNKTLGEHGKNEPKTNPIRTQTNPIKPKIKPKGTQYKPNQSQFHLRPKGWNSRGVFVARISHPESSIQNRASSIEHIFCRLHYFIGIYTGLHKLHRPRVVFYEPPRCAKHHYRFRNGLIEGCCS